jgi:hypothetical protein
MWAIWTDNKGEYDYSIDFCNTLETAATIAIEVTSEASPVPKSGFLTINSPGTRILFQERPKQKGRACR